MNDGSIPFIRRYGEWAIEAAARGSAAHWRKERYKDGTMEVPENKQYLAANSAKRDPNAPRGARFPARPSKTNRALTPDDEDCLDDGRIPILPPGPPTLSDPFGSTGWGSAPLFDRPTHPVPSPSQLPLGGFGSFPQTQALTTSPAIPWGPANPRSLPSSGTLTNVSYWENPLPCACTSHIQSLVADTHKHLWVSDPRTCGMTPVRHIRLDAVRA